MHPGFAEIHCVFGNVVQAALDAITVAGPGEEKPVVPGGAAISDQTWSLFPLGTAFLPVEMITEIGRVISKGHVAVGVAVAVGVRVAVEVGGGVGVFVGV